MPLQKVELICNFFLFVIACIGLLVLLWKMYRELLPSSELQALQAVKERIIEEWALTWLSDAREVSKENLSRKTKLSPAEVRLGTIAASVNFGVALSGSSRIKRVRDLVRNIATQTPMEIKLPVEFGKGKQDLELGG